MKKVTRLLILTAFVVPLIMSSRAYAGGPGQGQRSNFAERDRLGLHPWNSATTEGWRATSPDNNPLGLSNPIGGSGPDIDRNDLWHRPIVGGRDPFPGAGRPFDPTAGNGAGNGGGTAPIDGGISLLLAAGIGLGLKRAKARKETV
jgi:hypothetical protein